MRVLKEDRGTEDEMNLILKSDETNYDDEDVHDVNILQVMAKIICKPVVSGL